MRNVDLYCESCESRQPNVMRNPDDPLPTCATCGMCMAEDWWTMTRAHDAEWGDSTAVHVFRDPRTGQIRYPGRTDAKCPTGYERVILRSLRAVEKFEREHNVRNEAMYYDRGSGRGFDDKFFGKPYHAEFNREP